MTDPTPITMADIRKMVTDTIGEALKGVTPEKTPDKAEDKPAGSVADLVRAEIEKLRGAEKQKEKEAGIDQKLAELSQAIVEKPPVERRRVHKIMGWGE